MYASYVSGILAMLHCWVESFWVPGTRNGVGSNNVEPGKGDMSFLFGFLSLGHGCYIMDLFDEGSRKNGLSQLPPFKEIPYNFTYKYK
jgi:hypothetical protein